MEIPRFLQASAFLALLLIYDNGVQAVQTNQLASNAVSGAANRRKIDCGISCASRCKLSGMPNLCTRACGTCCAKCICAPPGTYGSYEACPCYAKLTTHGKKPKCP